MAKILLTRPRAASEKLAETLKGLGFDCVIEPLLTIEPLNSTAPDMKNIQAVMITSANALDVLAEQGADIAELFHLPCFCVGLRTAEKAQDFGFTNIHAGGSDGIELAQLITATHQGHSVLHIAGKDTDRKAQTELEKFGFQVIFWPVYEAIAATELTDKTAQLLKRQGVDVVLVFSVRTAQTLATLVKQQGVEVACDRISAIGLSDAVTEALRPLPWRRIMSANEPTETAVIECLKRLYPAS